MDKLLIVNFLDSSLRGTKQSIQCLQNFFYCLLKAKQIALENYRRHPEYLFAKLIYAQLLLESGATEEFAEVFENKFDLSLLYPNRKVFHISEFVSFSGVIGLYYCEIGKLDSAEVIDKLLKKIVPNHPVTKTLEEKLLGVLLKVSFT